MTLDVVCPTCGTASSFDELGPDSAAFCRVCDYPLFWVQAAHRTREQDEGLGAVGLRRLPGTAGRVAVATLPCPVCTEHNPVTGVYCIRCGADLHPAPPPVPLPPPPPPLPPPPPPPPPPRRVLWPWILLGALALAAVVVLIILLA